MIWKNRFTQPGRLFLGAVLVASAAAPTAASATLTTYAGCSPPRADSPFYDQGNKPMSTVSCPLIPPSNVGTASAGGSAFASYGALGGFGFASQTLLQTGTINLSASYSDSAVVSLGVAHRVFAVVPNPELRIEGSIQKTPGQSASGWSAGSTFTVNNSNSSRLNDYRWRRTVGESDTTEGLRRTDTVFVQGRQRFEIADGDLLGFSGFLQAAAGARNNLASSASFSVSAGAQNVAEQFALADAVDEAAGLTDLGALLNNTPYGAFWSGLRFEDEFGNPIDSALVRLVSRSGVDWTHSFAPEVGSTVPVPATAALAMLAIGLMGWRRSRERSDIDPASQTERALI